jgi:hypothetical protein
MTMRTIALWLFCLATEYGYGFDLQMQEALDDKTQALASILVGLNVGALSPSRHIKAKGPSVKVKSPLNVDGEGWKLSVPISITGTTIKVPLQFVIKGLKGAQLTIPLTFAIQKLLKLVCKPSVGACELALKDPYKFDAAGVPMSTSLTFAGNGLRQVSFPIKFTLFGHEVVMPFSYSDLTSVKKIFDGRSLADFAVKDSSGFSVDLSKYKGKVVLVADAKGLSASDYAELYRLQKKFKGRGLQVLILGSTGTMQEMTVFARDLLFFGPKHLDRKSALPLLEWLKEHIGGTNMYIVGRNGKAVASGKSLERQIAKSLKVLGLF